MTLLETLGIELPIIQAPMAGVSSPAWRLRSRMPARSDRSASARAMPKARTA
jgi:hypothetical protein